MSLSQIPTSVTSHALKIILEKAGVTVQRELTQLESFGYFLEEYVIQGAELTIETNSYTVSKSVISFVDTLWSVPVFIGTTSLPDAIYFVSFTTDGIVSDLALPAVPFLPLWELTTDSNGDILTVEDKRGDMNYVRFKLEVLGMNPDIIEAALQATQDALDAALAANTAAEDVIGAIDAAYTAASAADSATATANAAEVVRSTAETDRVNAEDLRDVAELGRASAESARVLAESGRDSAEQARDSAETDRISAESSRVNAEGLRASAESTRATDETARQNAESSRASAESNRETSESGRVTAESNRVSAESSRESAEGDRVSAESTRSVSESSRVAAESGRATAETTRQSNESTRESQESARQTNTTNAINQLNDTNDEFIVWEPYDNAKAYKPLNKVTYDGSSYVCKQASTGNLPTNKSYWLLAAQRGVDGTGSTSSVNNKFPDLDGNVELTAADVGAETPAGAQAKANAAETAAKTYADTGLGNKVDKEVGKGLSSEDYTATEKTKLAGIAAGAQVNTVDNVAGKTGNVALDKNDVGLPNVDNAKQATKTEFDSFVGTTNNTIGNMSTVPTTSKQVAGAITELFQSVSDGKDQLETAVTDMGGTVSKVGSVATFDELDTGIRGISVGAIQSIQRGTTTGMNGIKTLDIPITMVDSSKCLIFLSWYFSKNMTSAEGSIVPTFVDDSMIRLYRDKNYQAVDTINWQVVEFKGVRSKQTGITSLPLYNIEYNAPVSPVNVSKSFLLSYKTTIDPIITSQSGVYFFARSRIVDDSTLGFIASEQSQVYWQLLEFE